MIMKINWPVVSIGRLIRLVKMRLVPIRASKWDGFIRTRRFDWVECLESEMWKILAIYNDNENELTSCIGWSVNEISRNEIKSSCQETMIMKINWPVVSIGRFFRFGEIRWSPIGASKWNRLQKSVETIRVGSIGMVSWSVQNNPVGAMKRIIHRSSRRH